jgi:hypothetical protein
LPIGFSLFASPGRSEHLQWQLARRILYRVTNKQKPHAHPDVRHERLNQTPPLKEAPQQLNKSANLLPFVVGIAGRFH